VGAQFLDWFSEQIPRMGSCQTFALCDFQLPLEDERERLDERPFVAPRVRVRLVPGDAEVRLRVVRPEEARLLAEPRLLVDARLLALVLRLLVLRLLVLRLLVLRLLVLRLLVRRRVVPPRSSRGTSLRTTSLTRRVSSAVRNFAIRSSSRMIRLASCTVSRSPTSVAKVRMRL
jgi:hypothetical protein